MSSNGTKSGSGAATTALVIAIVTAVIFAIFAAVCFFSLQACIKEQQNNLCPSPNDNTVT